jgi:uncharacterized protein (TIGR03435 family)
LRLALVGFLGLLSPLLMPLSLRALVQESGPGAKGKQRLSPKVGIELSTVSGISLVRESDAQEVADAESLKANKLSLFSGRYVHVNQFTGPGVNEATLEGALSSLAEVLAAAADIKSALVVGSAMLPPGIYKVKVKAIDRKELLPKLSKACERAFKVRASLQKRDFKVLVLSQDKSWNKNGFRPTVKKRMMLSSQGVGIPEDGVHETVRFESASIDVIADKIETATGKAVFNETGIKGDFDGQFAYGRKTALADLQKEMKRHGLRLELVTRDVEILVIEKAS